MASKFQPYVGPRPFEQKDKYIFFGREREARDLLSLIIAHNVVLVYAQSGAGKSSLLNARLVPMLKENGFEVFPVARVKGMPTGKIKNEDIPNIFVFNTLMSWEEGEKLIDLKKVSQMTLVNFLDERKHPVDDTGQELPRAIIFDQFEELFSLSQDRWKDRAGFFEQIRDALKDPFLRVVFVMREDYIAQLDPYINLLPEKLRTRFRLERLNKESALMAVKEPLKNTGRWFAEGVAEKLVDDLLKISVETNPGETIEVIGEFIEAVQLQVICQNLWQGLPEDVLEINMSHLDVFGNVEKSLSQFYDDSIREAAQISRVDEEPLRKWFEEILITSIGTRGTVYRAPESTGGIPNAAIDILESKHLIRAEIRAGARWYELTHDKFIKPIQSSNKSYRMKGTDSTEKEEASRRANQAITKAEQAWGENNCDEALKYFEEALAIYWSINDSWGIANTYINIGNINYETESYALMIEKCEKALEINPNYAPAYYNWGRALRKLRIYDEAIKKYQKVIEIDPKYINAYNGWGNALSDLKKYDEAIEKYQKAIKIDSKYVDAYNGWGAALLNLEKYDEAIERFQKAIDIDPNYVNAYNGLGNALSNLKKYDEAIEKYQKTIKIDSKYVDAYNGWGVALLNLEKYDEAIEKYQKAIDIDPKYINAYIGWGSALIYLKKYDEAIEKYQKAIEIDSKYVDVYNEWGYVLLKLKKYDEAIEKFQKTLEIDPNYASGWYNKACSLSLANGDIEEISKCLARAIELDSKYIQMAKDDLDFKSVKNQLWFKNLLSNKVEV